ncbi:MAG: sialate O-acetylesterase, partial [Planctomycetales bacterium]
MKTMKSVVGSCLLLSLGLMFPTGAAAAEPKGMLRVFILSGQSNMEGKGAIKHLEALLADLKTAAAFQHLRDGDGWTERDDVRIVFGDREGPLTVGYAVPTNRVGPELQFGHVVGDALDNPVLIIKAAWGGKSLFRDFLSPSGKKPSDAFIQALEDKAKKKKKPFSKEEYMKEFG